MDQVSVPSQSITVVLKNSSCCVQYKEESSSNKAQTKIGRGNMRVEFLYENRNSPAFPPVYVENEDAVRALAAFVAEKAHDFKRRSGETIVGQFPQYDTLAEVAKHLVDKSVIKHVQQCFTQKGMKQFKVGLKKRNYPKRSEIIKINEKINKEVNNSKMEHIDKGVKDEYKKVANDSKDVIPTAFKSTYSRGFEKLAKSGYDSTKLENKTNFKKLSKELSELLGAAPEDSLTKEEIVNNVWTYVKDHQLQDPNNKLCFTPDNRMKPIFGNKKIKWTVNNIQNYLKGHMQ